ncbi:MAG: hypothetical protein K0R62_7618 [Nonomuraea muscovyensis]|nr:hypothetical protein [Nonomuraea muscovyensis]
MGYPVCPGLGRAAVEGRSAVPLVALLARSAGRMGEDFQEV